MRRVEIFSKNIWTGVCDRHGFYRVRNDKQLVSLIRKMRKVYATHGEEIVGVHVGEEIVR